MNQAEWEFQRNKTSEIMSKNSMHLLLKTWMSFQFRFIIFLFFIFHFFVIIWLPAIKELHMAQLWSSLDTTISASPPRRLVSALTTTHRFTLHGNVCAAYDGLAMVISFSTLIRKIMYTILRVEGLLTHSKPMQI